MDSSGHRTEAAAFFTASSAASAMQRHACSALYGAGEGAEVLTLSGRRHLLLVLGVVTLVSLAPVPVSALTCRPLEDRTSLPAVRPAARHVVVEEFPSWAVAPIEEALRTVEGEASLRAALERRSAHELWRARKVWALDVLSASLVTFTLLWSCVWFIRRVAGLARRAQLRLLVRVLAVDTVVFILGGLAGATSSAPVALVATLLSMLVALVESVTCAVTLYRGPRIHEPSAV